MLPGAVPSAMNNAGVQADVHETASKAHAWEIGELMYLGAWEG